MDGHLISPPFCPERAVVPGAEGARLRVGNAERASCLVGLAYLFRSRAVERDLNTH
jgi:hypothetical protein